MYQQGDRVVYGSHGVCEVLNIEQKRIDKKYIEYYILFPVGNPGARFYVPTQNPSALSKLRPLLTAEQLKELLLDEVNSSDVWVDDENARKQKYKEVIASGDHADLIHWVHSLHHHRRTLLENGKKFHQADENFLKDAERILITEFSIVLNISVDAVEAYVRELVSV